MCGITGLAQLSPLEPTDTQNIKRIMEHLQHRGPDDFGSYRTRRTSHGNGVMLGHRRLSIIDLKTGQQPLVDPRTNTALVYNGEIYNYRSLRQKARRKHKYSFRTKTDSEVILPLYRHHGPGFVTMLRGMFAFALWDPARERLLLTRDRMGQKPLFYHRSNGKIVFSSELGALAHCDSIPTSVSDEALYLYTVLGYIPAPFTIYEELFQLPPACTFIWEDGRVSITSYWSLPPPGETNPIKNTEETRERFRALFRDAVETRMQADVPVGAFLSGGLDSSAIVSMMARKMEEPVQTFSIGFSDPDFDETVFAEKQSEYAGTNHRSQTVNPSTLDVLPKLARHFGEPFADSSAIPTYYLSNFAAEEVKVALSGDGGDECFGGYNRYRAMKFLQSLRFLSRSTLASELISWITDLLPTPEQRLGTSRVAVRLLQLLPFDPVQQYLRISGLFSPEEARSIIKNKHHSVPDDLVSHLFEERMEEGPFPSESGGAANVDLHLYLPGDLLTKVDITSMAHSLEVRSPFLDPNILSFSARLPMSENLTMFQSKMFLKQAMTNDLHPDIRNRSKQGFGVPIGSWLRKKEGEDWLRELTRASSGTAKYFNHEQIVRMVREHRNGAKNHRDRLWLLLMFELWHREFMV